MPALRITLVAIGSRGDVQPMVAIGKTLQQRGHTVRLVAPPDFADWITSQGLDFAPVGVAMKAFMLAHPEMMTGRPSQIIRAARDYFIDQLPVHAQAIEAASTDADVIVWAGLAVAAVSVGEHLKRPVLGVLFSTCVLPSGRHPPMSCPWHGLPAWLNRLLWTLNRQLANRVAGDVHNRLRAQWQLPPVRLREYMQAASDYVVAADPELFPLDPQWPSSVTAANYIYYDDPAPLPAELEDWLDAGEPPVFVGFGSMSGDATQRIEPVVREALAQVGRRCLLSAGWAGLGGAALPPGWRVVQDVPHARLFPRMAAVVHHGGSGTTGICLRSGVPQLIVPLILDHYHHAHRLYVAGLTPRPASMEKITARQLADALHAVIAQDPGLRRQVAARLAASDGCGDVARRIESLAATAGAP